MPEPKATWRRVLIDIGLVLVVISVLSLLGYAGIRQMLASRKAPRPRVVITCPHCGKTINLNPEKGEDR